MPDRKPRPEEPKAAEKGSVGAEPLSLEPLGELQVKYEPVAPKAPEGKQIHPRRPAPLVPDAPESDAAEDDARQQSRSKKPSSG
jgi:hypothetical protein